MADQKLSLDEVRHVARLSRLDLPQEQLQRFTTQLASILQYVDKIGELDVKDVEPMAHALPLANVFRDDMVRPSLSTEQVLMNAPETDGPFFKVPKIIADE